MIDPWHVGIALSGVIVVIGVLFLVAGALDHDSEMVELGANILTIIFVAWSFVFFAGFIAYLGISATTPFVDIQLPTI